MGQQSTMEIKVDGATFSGRNVADQGTTDITGTVEGNAVAWQQKLEKPFPSPSTARPRSKAAP
ncbi:hypothetical protein AB5I41_14695 [Sphingomonas sp. MMS24-JH45]